jgi:hypothetical protein
MLQHDVAATATSNVFMLHGGLHAVHGGTAHFAQLLLHYTHLTNRSAVTVTDARMSIFTC